MLISPVFAQAGAPGTSDFLFQMLPFLLIFVVMYLLIIRPQQQRMKTHKEMLANIKRGDTVITSGGIVGKVVRVVDEGELQVEIADNVRVRLMRAMVAEVRAKGEPVKDATS
ncbi:MAG: preprotein translocase subunit YajC [Hyphomicrobiaceae bacterium]